MLLFPYLCARCLQSVNLLIVFACTYICMYSMYICNQGLCSYRFCCWHYRRCAAPHGATITYKMSVCFTRKRKAFSINVSPSLVVNVTSFVAYVIARHCDLMLHQRTIELFPLPLLALGCLEGLIMQLGDVFVDIERSFILFLRIARSTKANSLADVQVQSSGLRRQISGYACRCGIFVCNCAS